MPFMQAYVRRRDEIAGGSWRCRVVPFEVALDAARRTSLLLLSNDEFGELLVRRTTVPFSLGLFGDCVRDAGSPELGVVLVLLLLLDDRFATSVVGDSVRRRLLLRSPPFVLPADWRGEYVLEIVGCRTKSLVIAVLVAERDGAMPLYVELFTRPIASCVRRFDVNGLPVRTLVRVEVIGFDVEAEEGLRRDPAWPTELLLGDREEGEEATFVRVIFPVGFLPSFTGSGEPFRYLLLDERVAKGERMGAGGARRA